MAVTPIRRPRHDSTPVIAVVVALGVILASLLVWQSTQSQERLSTLRNGQVNGTVQRTDTQQLSCALWAVLRSDDTRKIPADLRQAADKICANVPTPAPSETP